MSGFVRSMMSPQDPATEVERLRSAVAKHFPIYDVNVSYRSVTMLVNAVAETVDESFDKLRSELKEMGYIPYIRYKGGEYAITIVRKPPLRQGNLWINRTLAVATFFTTALAGMVLWSDYSGASNMLTLENFLFGALFFALPLLFILGTHELSHYYASKRNGVEASLPYFIPFIPPFGTMGAFISLRDPMPNRKALVEIGAAGPLGGIIATLPIALIGLYLTSQGQPVDGPVGEGALYIVMQPLYILMGLLFPLQDNLALHPTAFAAWVGFFVTAINLLPAGQLDGGHIAQGLLGDKARYLSYATAGLLIVLSFTFYTGWLVFAMLVVLLGLTHPAPLNDITRPGPRAKAMGAAALIVFALTFVPTPLMYVEPDHSFSMDVENGNITAHPGDIVEFHLSLVNKGNADSKLHLALHDIPWMWSGSVQVSGTDDPGATEQLDVDLEHGGTVNVTVKLRVSGDAEPGQSKVVRITASGHGVEQVKELKVTVE
jgi:hypothetical protein